MQANIHTKALNQRPSSYFQRHGDRVLPYGKPDEKELTVGREESLGGGHDKRVAIEPGIGNKSNERTGITVQQSAETAIDRWVNQKE